MKWKNKKDKKDRKYTDAEIDKSSEEAHSEGSEKTQILTRDENVNSNTDLRFRNRIPHSWEGVDEGNSGDDHSHRPPDEDGSNYNPFEDDSNGEPMVPII